jgi:molecular chaperone GrpE (heat shock protein)
MMNFFKKKISEFKPIQIDNNQKYNDSIYIELSKLLKRIGRSEQKSSQISELLKDEISEKLSKYDEIIDQVREKNIQQGTYLKTLEKGLLDYMDIIDNFEKVKEEIEDQTLLSSINVAVNIKDQINNKIGVLQLPGVGADIDIEAHYIIKTEETDNMQLDKKVKEVVEQGYRIGERLLRKATIIGYKYRGTNEK